MEIVLVIVVLVLVVALAVVVWRGRHSGSVAGAGDQRTLVAQLEVQLGERDRQLSEALAERDTARAERDEVRGEREAALQELAAVKADHEARTEELAKAQKEVETKFKGIADDVTKANSEAFLKQARAQFEDQQKLGDADLARRQKAIDELVKPVKENLAKFEKRVNEIEEKRKGAYEGLNSQVKQLLETAGGLREALRSPQVRGLWGEQTLRNILEVSGMREHIDFFEQNSVAADDRRLQPDVVVRVPDGAEVVIDAKTPLDSYLKAHSEKDDQRQGELLQSHARSLMDRAKELGDKDYAAAVDGSPDFTVMFVPADPILDAAIDVQPTLWDEAWRRHQVLIATPGLLLAFLKTVALAWQQQDLQENARTIADTGKELYERLGKYTKDVAKMGRGLSQAVNAYNASVGALEGRVLPSARRLESLGPAAGLSPIEQPSQMDAFPRQVAAPELVETEAEPSGRELPGVEGD